MEPAISALERLFSDNPEIELLNFYKSCPVSMPAKIIEVEKDGTLKVKVSPPGSVCLYQNKTTVILSPTLAQVIRAKIRRFDIADGIVLLQDYSYLSAWTGQRMVVRVQPEHNIDVLLQKDERMIQAVVADISINGIGVLVQTLDLEENDTLSIHLSLPTGDSILRGLVVEVIPQDGIFRLGIKFLPNSRDISFMLKYITSRRQEILDELAGVYASVYRTAKA